MIRNIQKKILFGITGYTCKDVISKIHELNKLKIKKAALFVSCISKKSEREQIYEELLKSTIKYIPLVHIRNDMDKDELIFLKKKFRTRCFNFHETGFNYLEKWHGFYKNLYLEMNKDDSLSKKVQVEKIGGFCIDLSHLMSARRKSTKEYDYVSQRRNKKLFVCNHISGYCPVKITDLHEVDNLQSFDYLTDLPEYLFGKYIAIEVMNPIEYQVQIKKYISKILS